MLWLRRLNLAALILCFAVVVFGAFVRLSDAGLGCPDWPGCYGQITVPDAPHEVAAAQQSYPARPLEPHKAWKEMIHRYLASTLGLLIVALALLSRVYRNSGAPRVLPWVLVGLVIFQGMLGMWTVTWQLKPLAVSGHLLGGMTTLALLLWQWLGLRAASASAAQAAPGNEKEYRSERQLWFAMQSGSSAAPIAAPKGLKPLAVLALVLLAVQIFLGGWTSSNYAALACPDFPTCQGSLWPETDAKEAFTLWRGLGINYEYGVLDNRARVTIHFAHRLGALAVTLLFAGIGLYLWRRGREQVWRGLGLMLLGALALQVLIGISMVYLQLPLLLAAGHNAGAALLLLVTITLNHYAWKAAPSPS